LTLGRRVHTSETDPPAQMPRPPPKCHPSGFEQKTSAALIHVDFHVSKGRVAAFRQDFATDRSESPRDSHWHGSAQNGH